MYFLMTNLKNIGPSLIYAAMAFVLSAIFMKLLLPVLRRLKAGQSIREDGPQAHLAKAGTPTMGGLSMIAATGLAVLCGGLLRIGFHPEDSHVLGKLGLPFLVMAAYGIIGFLDDYIKVVKKHNEGLTPGQKMGLQLLVAFIFAVLNSGSSYMLIPFIGYIQVGRIFNIFFEVFVMIAMTNAVNLTDGLDGLAASVTSVVALFFMLLAPSLLLSSTGYFAACMFGSCLGFLIYNHHPAKVFMGDTGSLALGGALASMASSSAAEWLLPIAGGIFVAEAASVIIQVFVFKTQNGRRFFRMAPLHHHFELGGWNEEKVVRVFTLATAILCIVAFCGILVAQTHLY